MPNDTPNTPPVNPTQPPINEMYLGRAVNQIKQACDERREKEQHSPFFFIVGAGISFPPIPLAGAIVEDCKAKAIALGRTEEPTDGAAVDNYSYWFQAAYPQPIERQDYLRRKIENKPISHANFRLAHILLHKQIANLVVTPNFDDLLQRALTLFGRTPVVCDHPKTVGRIYHEQDENDIRIVHVHGTYWFYDCVNLKGELEGCAQTDIQSTLTMGALLTKILADRSPLVVGYSGWEGDVIMKSLELLLKSRQPPYNIYWFCHKRSDIEGLPDWLKNASVNFVIPEEEADHSNETEPDSKDGDVESSSVTSDKPVLMAQQVFDAVIKEFNLPAPDFTTNPLRVFASNLRDSLPQDEEERGHGEPYFFGSIIERIEKVRDAETAMRTQMEKVRDAVRRSQYEEAVTAVQGVTAGSMTKTDLIDLLSLSQSIAPGVASDALKQKQLYGAVTHIVDAILQLDNPDDLDLQRRIAWALACKAYWFADANIPAASTKVCDDILNRFASSSDPELRERVAWAMIRKGSNLITGGQNDEALTVFNDVVQDYGKAPEIALKKHVATVLINKATRLQIAQNYQDAINVSEDIIQRFQQSTDAVLCQQVAQAVILKTQAAVALQKASEQKTAPIPEQTVTRTPAEAPAKVQAQAAKAEDREAGTDKG